MHVKVSIGGSHVPTKRLIAANVQSRAPYLCESPSTGIVNLTWSGRPSRPSLLSVGSPIDAPGTSLHRPPHHRRQEDTTPA
jgi:hypothetical protein